jgi:hypothetical protein
MIPALVLLALLWLPVFLIYPEIAQMLRAGQDRPRVLLVAWILAMGWPFYLWDEVRSRRWARGRK